LRPNIVPRWRSDRSLPATCRIDLEVAPFGRDIDDGMLDRLDWPMWQAASAEERDAIVAAAAARVGGRLEERTFGPCVALRGRSLVVVPGGTVDLGWDGAPAQLTPSQRAAWMEDATADSFEAFLRLCLGSRRRVTLAPMLLEIRPQPASELGANDADDPEQAVRAAVTAEGFRLPTNDEWENAVRAGATAMFRWGDAWPDGEPYPGRTTFTAHTLPTRLGLAMLHNPYQVEVVAETDWVRGGDGGVALCGGRPAPEAWYSFALAFQLPRAWWEDCVVETYETAHARRALSL
jgi:hypothetical protein